MTGDALSESLSLVLPPTGLTLDSLTASGVEVSWDAVTDADGYEVSLWVSGEEVDADVATTTSTSITTEEMAALGGPWTTFVVQVVTIKDEQLSENAASLTVSVDELDAPINFAVQAILESAAILNIELVRCQQRDRLRGLQWVGGWL